jgi:hypothetical protein
MQSLQAKCKNVISKEIVKGINNAPQLIRDEILADLNISIDKICNDRVNSKLSVLPEIVATMCNDNSSMFIEHSVPFEKYCSVFNNASPTVIRTAMSTARMVISVQTLNSRALFAHETYDHSTPDDSDEDMEGSEEDGDSSSTNNTAEHSDTENEDENMKSIADDGDYSDYVYN